MINYTKISSAYLSQMVELKKKEERTWNTIKDRSFCVAKSKVPFTAFYTDHEIEQGNQILKVFGEIKGTLSGLKQFFCNWKPFKNDEKCFLFHLEIPFRSQGI